MTHSVCPLNTRFSDNNCTKKKFRSHYLALLIPKAYQIITHGIFPTKGCWVFISPHGLTENIFVYNHKVA